MAVKITGLDDVLLNLNEFAFDMEKATERAVKSIAVQVQSGAVKAIKNPSVGTYVTRYTAAGKPYSHVASKEGDAPNSDTGRLIGSVNMSHNTGDLFAYVFTNLEYGFYLETVLNRPWLEPAKEAKKGAFADEISRALDNQIKQAGK